MTHDQIVEHYATTLVRIAQTMTARATREDMKIGNEEHAFDLEAMDQYAAKVRAVAEMLRMEIGWKPSPVPGVEGKELRR